MRSSMVLVVVASAISTTGALASPAGGGLSGLSGLEAWQAQAPAYGRMKLERQLESPARLRLRARSALPGIRPPPGGYKAAPQRAVDAHLAASQQFSKSADPHSQAIAAAHNQAADAHKAHINAIDEHGPHAMATQDKAVAAYKASRVAKAEQEHHQVMAHHEAQKAAAAQQKQQAAPAKLASLHAHADQLRNQPKPQHPPASPHDEDKTKHGYWGPEVKAQDEHLYSGSRT